MDNQPTFEGFPKMARLSRGITVTEKIDGTNGQIYIAEDGGFHVGSRNRWITPEDDNYGFAAWAYYNREELAAVLGYGRHFGEWWGAGIQRRYGQTEKHFSLFNTARWDDENKPSCCLVVPVLYRGPFDQGAIDFVINELDENGSVAANGFMQPEGIVIYHEAARMTFKKTIKDDHQPKGMAA